MKTMYCCRECDKHFEDESGPNINKKHRCGNFVQITEIEDATEPEAEQ